MNRLVFPATAAFFACAALVHCSSSDSSPAGTDAGAPPPPVGGAMPTTMPTPPPTPADGGADADAGMDATTVTTPGPSGFVLVDSYSFTSPSIQIAHEFTAAFGHPTAASPTVTTTTVGPCKVAQQSDASAPGAVDNAGDITLSKGGTTLATLTTNDAGTYDTQSLPSVLTAGTTYHLAAAGAAVPAFAADLVAPSAATITTPNISAGASVAFDRAKDFALAWIGGAPGRFGVKIYDASGYLTVTCDFDAAAGSGVIPKAALASIAGTTGGVGFFVTDTQHLTAGTFAVDATLEFIPNASDGSNGSLRGATFQ